MEIARCERAIQRLLAALKRASMTGLCSSTCWKQGMSALLGPFIAGVNHAPAQCCCLSGEP